MAKDNATCSIDGCENPVRARELCSSHYSKFLRNGGERIWAPRSEPGAECSVDGCGKPIASRGWCNTHYTRWRKTGDVKADKPERARYESGATCSIKGCNKLIRAKGWCNMHYQRAAKYGDPETVLQQHLRYEPGTSCSADGCDRPVLAKKLCSSHHAQVLRTGSKPVAFKYTKSPCVPCLNCGQEHAGKKSRKFCSETCRTMYRKHGGPRPTSKMCAQCGDVIDLNARTKQGRLRNSYIKLCKPCTRTGYELSAAELVERDGTECSICGDPVDMSIPWPDDNSPSVDHVIPRSKGGSHAAHNLALAHLGCNRDKSDKIST